MKARTLDRFVNKLQKCTQFNFQSSMTLVNIVENCEEFSVVQTYLMLLHENLSNLLAERLLRFPWLRCSVSKQCYSILILSKTLTMILIFRLSKTAQKPLICKQDVTYKLDYNMMIFFWVTI